MCVFYLLSVLPVFLLLVLALSASVGVFRWKAFWSGVRLKLVGDWVVVSHICCLIKRHKIDFTNPMLA